MDRSYVAGGAGSSSSADAQPEAGYWSLGKLKKSYQDYLGSKREEIDEQQNARRYYHAAQWTEAEVQALKARRQPVVTFNRIGRKIDGVVGLLERLRQDPKAYPRTPQHDQDAELATACIRYVLDEQEWKAKAPECARDGAVDGIGGIGLELEKGDKGDTEIGFEIVEPDTWFYDPRSVRLDFSDARYCGVAKWMDVDAAKELVPSKAEELDGITASDSDLSTQSDRDVKWIDSNSGVVRRIRVVDCWYMHNGEWCWSLFTGSTKLMEGKSFLTDEKKKTFCKYIMFSANVDQDGDRYGFVRNMKSAQDEINHRRSKGLHELSTRRIIAEVGAFDDIEVARRELARPDGVVQRNRGFEAEMDDSSKMANIEGQFKFLENAYAELENFGPNPALIGEGIENKSGRAIQLLQQAGTAELGPYILAYRGWKIRVYRALFNAIRQHWTAERFIRVTDEQDVPSFVGINKLGIDPQTGMPAIVNNMSALDVDIILDEGADQVNMMMDAYDTLTVLASKGANIPPQVLIELSPLESSVKKRILEMMKQPNPQQEVAMAGEQAKVQQTQADAKLKEAQTVKTMAEAQTLPAQIQADAMGNMMPGQSGEYQLPPELENMKAMAEIEDKQASAEHKRAQAMKAQQEAYLAPQKMHLEAMNAHEDRRLTEMNAAADRKLAAKQASQRAPA